MNHLRRASVAAACAAAGLVVAGCGSSGGETTATSADASKTGGGGGKTVVLAVPALPDSLTPNPWAGSASHTVFTGLGSQLARLDFRDLPDNGCGAVPDGRTLVGNLAESIRLSPDRRTLTVTLRDLKSQVGNTLSAEDVKWSMDFTMAVQPVAIRTLETAGFDTRNLVRIIDRRTVELTIKRPTSFSAEMLQNNLLNVFDSTEAKKNVTDADPWANAWLSRNLADYSGWKLESFTPGSALTVTANPEWGGERGNVERVVVQAVPTNSTREQIATSGDADLVSGLEYAQYKKVDEAPGVSVLQCASVNRDTLVLSSRGGALRDPKVRQAISMALDRDTILASAYAGYGKAATSAMPSQIGFQEPDNAYRFDPEGAKRLLAEAGYADGFPLTITLSQTRPGPVVVRSSVLLQSMLRDVGIDVTLREMGSPTDFSTVTMEGTYEALMTGEPPVLTDPAYLGWVNLFSTAPNNTHGWASREYDETITRLQSIPVDQVEERKALVADLARIANDGSAILYLVEPPNMFVVRDGITGATPNPNGQIRWTNLDKQ